MTDQFELLETTVREIHEAMEAGEVTSQELTAQYIDRIEAFDRDGPELNGIVTVNSNATDRATELDEILSDNGMVGPLHGIPILVKDQAETAGITTTFGSEAFDEYVPETDATIIQKLENAGAIILAKTNLPDWAASWFGYSSVLGQTKNPYALDRDPGGTSAGTGAGVAANLGTIGIGEDTGGSVRVPSSYCNLYGIRVTTGLVSRTGLQPLVKRQDTAGPMARTVEDMVRLLDVIVGYDPDDEWTSATALTDSVGSYSESIDRDALDGARLGILRDAFGDGSEATSVNDLVGDALELMEEAGAEIVDPVEIPNLEEQIEETSLYVVQSKRDINEFLAERPEAPVDSIEEVYDSGSYHELLDLLEDIAEGPADPASDPDYWRKVAAQESLRRDIVNAHAEHDLDAIVFPDVQRVPPTQEWLHEGVSTADYPTNTVIGSQSSCPAVSMPAGFTDEGLPVGVELLGKPFTESKLIGLAASFEAVADSRRPPDSAPELTE